jgi:hypothetical protein
VVPLGNWASIGGGLAMWFLESLLPSLVAGVLLLFMPERFKQKCLSLLPNLRLYRPSTVKRMIAEAQIEERRRCAEIFSQKEGELQEKFKEYEIFVEGMTEKKVDEIFLLLDGQASGNVGTKK